MRKAYFVLAGLIFLMMGTFVGTLAAAKAVEATEPRQIATASGTSAVNFTVFEVPATSFDVQPINAYVKVSDIGTFTVQGSNSVTELTFNGNILSGSSGFTFQLRVDDSPFIGDPAEFWSASGPFPPVSITGIFPNLSAGPHTASIWAKTSSQTTIFINAISGPPSRLFVREFTSGKYVYLPYVSKP